MTSNIRTPRRGALAAAVAAVLCAAPALLAAQSTTQPPAGGADMGQPPAGGPGMGGMGGPGMRGPRGPGMLLEGITLTDAQRTRVDSVNRAFGEHMRARREQMMQSGGGPGQGNSADGARPDSAARVARFAEMRREMTERNAAIRAVLTGDQQKTFDANVARMEQMRQQRMRDGGPGR